MSQGQLTQDELIDQLQRRMPPGTSVMGIGPRLTQEIVDSAVTCAHDALQFLDQQEALGLL